MDVFCTTRWTTRKKNEKAGSPLSLSGCVWLRVQSNATPSLSQMITNERSVALRPWHVAVWQAASEKMKEDGRWDSEGWDWEHEDGLREGRERRRVSRIRAIICGGAGRERIREGRSRSAMLPTSVK